MVGQETTVRVDLFEIVVKRLSTGQESTEIITLTPGDKLVQGMELMQIVDHIYPPAYYGLLDITDSDGLSLFPFVHYR